MIDERGRQSEEPDPWEPAGVASALPAKVSVRIDGRDVWVGGWLYVVRSERDGDRKVPCVLAGPTCDSADVLYEKEPYPLPISLEIGDKVLIEGTGAYTTTYSAVAFNGFPPLKSYVI